MNLCLAIIAWGSVSFGGVPQEVPNRIATEMVLRGAQLSTDAASMVTGMTTWRSDRSGITHRHGTVAWRELNGAEVLPPTTDPKPNDRFCTQLNGHDPVPGNRQLHLYRSEDLDPEFPSPGDEQPTLILGTGPASEMVFATLKPGDTVQLTEAVRTSDGLRAEHLSITRGRRTLSLTREGEGTQVCYTDPG